MTTVNRLSSPVAFRSVFSTGRSYAQGSVVMYVAKRATGGGPARAGFVVSRRVWIWWWSLVHPSPERPIETWQGTCGLSWPPRAFGPAMGGDQAIAPGGTELGCTCADRRHRRLSAVD